MGGAGGRKRATRPGGRRKASMASDEPEIRRAYTARLILGERLSCRCGYPSLAAPTARRPVAGPCLQRQGVCSARLVCHDAFKYTVVRARGVITCRFC